jgi:hypothetical protein
LLYKYAIRINFCFIRTRYVIRIKKTPLISKYLSKTFQVNEQSTKYSIILVSPTIEKKEGTKYQDEIPIINISNKPCQFRNTDDWAEYTIGDK